MRTTGKYYYSEEITEEENKEQEMLEEVSNARQYLREYTQNIDSLLGKEFSSEVKKSMINFLVEQL